MHPIQEGQAPRVGEEVPHLRPFGAGEILQRTGDRGGGPVAVVEPAIGIEQLQSTGGAAPGRLEPLDLLERRTRSPPGGPGRVRRTSRIDPLPLRPGEFDVGLLGVLPGPLSLTSAPLRNS